jgi:tryptophan-rich sensory protein
MMMFFPLPLSATSGRTKALLLASPIVLIGNGCVSTVMITINETSRFSTNYIVPFSILLPFT